MRRRGKGEGSIAQRADGRWMGRLPLGRGLDGRRQYKAIYGTTEADVIEQMKRQGGRAVDGLLTTSSTPTVASFLDDWYRTYADEWTPATQRSYRGAIDHHLIPAFGPIRLEQLTALRIQQWVNAHKAEHGARRRIELAHAVLRSALAEAQRNQLIAINFATLTKLPKRKKRTITPLNVEQAKTFLAHAKTHRLYALFSVALACGLREGEALGLEWRDTNLEAGEIHIRQQLQRVGKQFVLQDLKTEKSDRRLTLPDVCIEALKDHRTRQREERLKAGERWVDSGLVFTTYMLTKKGKGKNTKVGAPLHPRNLLRVLYALLDDADLDRCRFHDLRHSAASLLLANGVSLAEVGKLLGHSQLRLTSDLYSHLMKETATKAARAMDSVLG